MIFRRRTFPEVLESLLTTLTGGVAAEDHPFPPPDASGPPFVFSLQQPPVARVISVWGSRDGEPHLFRPDTDYKLNGDGQTLQWQPNAELPDAGSLVQVNYTPAAARPELTDIQVGSVVRTLAETMALEAARIYAQLEAVYDSGFIDTATGKALDNVVALLGTERTRGGKAAGTVEFTRAPGSHGTITILAGTHVITPDAKLTYETTDTITMVEGQTTIRVTARDLGINDPLPANALTVLPIPIAGVAGVTNPAPTSIATQDETDEELRARAKNFLHGSERATLGAIKQALAGLQITADVEEVDDANGCRFVQITPRGELTPEQQQLLATAVLAVRPAGVLVPLPTTGRPAKTLNIELRVTSKAGLLERDVRAAQRAVRKKVKDYFAGLSIKENASVNRIAALALSVPEVADVRIVRATLLDGDTEQNVLDVAAGVLNLKDVAAVLGELQIADPALPTNLRALVTYARGAAAPDSGAIRAALETLLTGVNTRNSSEGAAETLSYADLLAAVPLPTGGAAGAYTVRFVVTQEGLSRILQAPTDRAYALAPLERLALEGVEVAPEAAA